MNRTQLLRIFQAQLILAEAIERIYVRDKLGQFAKDNDLEKKATDYATKQTIKQVQRVAVNQSDQFTGLIKTKEDVERQAKFVNDVKQAQANTYKAFGITNEKVFEEALKSGFSAPDPLQDILFATIKTPAKTALGIDLEAPPEEVAKQVKKAYDEHENDAIIAASKTLGRSYLKHQHAMDKFRNLEDYGETEWVGQMGRMGAFAADLAWDATTIMGVAAIPGLFGAELTIEAMAPVVQAGIEKKVVLPLIAKDIYQESQDVLGEKPENVLMGLALGATMGGAINDAAKFAETHPEATAKAAKLTDELVAAAPKVEAFAEDINNAMEETGAIKLFTQEDLTFDDFMVGAKEIYKALPENDREIVATLTNGQLTK